MTPWGPSYTTSKAGFRYALLLQRSGDCACPCRNCVPVPKVADWRLDVLDDPALEEIHSLWIHYAVEDDNVARVNTVGDGLQFGWEPPALHQLLDVAFPHRTAGEQPYRSLGKLCFLGLEQFRCLLAPGPHVDCAAQDNRMVGREIVDRSSELNVTGQAGFAQYLANLFGDTGGRAMLRSIGHQTLLLPLASPPGYVCLS